jgi:hypothetical protein
MSDQPDVRPTQIVTVDEQGQTLHQIGALLAICGSLTPYVIEQHNENPHRKKELDGGVQCSVESLLINACDRLAKIVGEDARWAFDEVANTAKKQKFLENLEANRQLMQLQAVSVAESLRPSHREEPGMFKLNETLYAACSGPLEEWRWRMVGIGQSPSAALRDYDLRHMGQPASSLEVLEVLFPENRKRRK